MTDFSQITVTGSLVQHIRNEIIRGNFVPGERLRLRDLAERFNVSTQPIREALTELESEGLVKSEPRRGAVVTSLSPAELRDIYEIRATLEAMATKHAVQHLTDETLKFLNTLLDDIDHNLGQIVQLVALNYTFHTTIYQAAKRIHLLELNINLRHRTAHYLHAYMIDLGGMPLAQEEHRAILNACRAKDDAKAAELMHHHIYKVGKSISEYVETAYNKSS